ncbi:hypothetical protein Taro_001485 [Colocasia esculenta]|uniref:POTRA domain-containing protein n=1 Tax=Colocasia esculenta TaxID=4460 RepID=A0A843TIC0_COLES|nr:hypothetical protein [Colocasia esculenta]
MCREVASSACIEIEDAVVSASHFAVPVYQQDSGEGEQEGCEFPMAVPPEEEQDPEIEEVAGEENGADEDGDEGEEGEEDAEEEQEEEEEEERSEGGDRVSSRKEKMAGVLRRLSSRPVNLRVHDIVIKGNRRTPDSVIEAQVVDAFRSASTMQEVIRAASIASARLRSLGIFDSVVITLDAGPPELHNTTNVVIEVVEARNPLAGDIGVFTKPEARSWSLEGSLKWKNLFGYGDIWDATGAYGWDQTSELSVGISFPRLKTFSTPLMTRISLLSQDWLKFSSYNERLLGLSIGLVSTRYHDLAYNLTWRSLADPSRMSSPSIRKQLGHSLLSSLKYVFKVDRRDSHLRPTQGYAFVSTSQIGGLGDARFLRFVRQVSISTQLPCEFDIRGAVPLGLYNTALNLGVAAGIILPWGRGFMNLSTPVSERLYMGGQSSSLCTLGGPTSLLGFKLRGLGPTDSRRLIPSNREDNSNSSPGKDALGGDLAVTAFADLSFDLPLEMFREAGIHGHAFVCAGNLSTLTENEIRGFSFQKFVQSFRSSAGFGIIVPTKLFRVEINYCHILKQSENDHAKTGIQFNFSSPL